MNAQGGSKGGKGVLRAHAGYNSSKTWLINMLPAEKSVNNNSNNNNELIIIITTVMRMMFIVL